METTNNTYIYFRQNLGWSNRWDLWIRQDRQTNHLPFQVRRGMTMLEHLLQVSWPSCYYRWRCSDLSSSRLRTISWHWQRRRVAAPEGHDGFPAGLRSMAELPLSESWDKQCTHRMERRGSGKVKGSSRRWLRRISWSWPWSLQAKANWKCREISRYLRIFWCKWGNDRQMKSTKVPAKLFWREESVWAIGEPSWWNLAGRVSFRREETLPTIYATTTTITIHHPPSTHHCSPSPSLSPSNQSLPSLITMKANCCTLSNGNCEPISKWSFTGIDANILPKWWFRRIPQCHWPYTSYNAAISSRRSASRAVQPKFVAGQSAHS